MQVYPTRDQIEEKVGASVVDIGLYQTAFTHKSALRDFPDRESYERLEFVGDSILNFIVTRYLYERYPKSSEGFLTRIRTKLVSGSTLAELSSKLNLQDLLIMNDRANRSGWRNNDRIKEDVFEAIIGAMYLDTGIPACRRWITKLLDKYVEWDEILVDNNHKDMLMRACQSRNWNLPIYNVDSTMGPDHQKTFGMSVWVQGNMVGCGHDLNKKRAEQKAASEALRSLDITAPVCASTNI